MFVVHALWQRDPERGSGRLALWAEDSSVELPARRPGRAPKVQVHPFAATHDDLAELGLTGGKPTTATVTLPARGGRPLDSPHLIRNEPTAISGVTAARRWQVPVVEFDADLAADILAGLDPDRAAPATSFSHLLELSRFAYDLVGRGRLLPGVDADGPRATWRPVLTGPDAAWARSLVACLPPALAAVEPDQPLPVWVDALDSLVDAAARAALARTRLAAERTGSGRLKATTRAWLAALTGPERRFAATAAEVTILAEALGAWQRDVVTGPVRACFRLVEPTGEGTGDGHEDEVWQVRFALQASDEPSLVVDAAAVWRARGSLPALARQLDSPQETMLTELGKARRVYPDLDAALRTARPTALSLDTTAAHSFLRTAAPALATAGFGVQLPGWWTKPSSRLGVRITASTPPQPGLVAAGASQLGFASIAEFRHDLAVGGQILSADELNRLAALKTPLVRLRGQWIELDARRLAAGLKLVGRTGTATVGELLRLGLGVDHVGAKAVDGLPVEGVDADGWLGELLSGDAELRLDRVPVSDSFDGRLRPYQERGLAWLDFLHRAGLGGLLADDMGLGKTVQLLALLAHETDAAADRTAEGGAGPSLLICPMSLVGNWQREATRFTPHLRVHVHHGAERARGKHFTDAVAASDLVITTYSLAARDAAELRRITWRRVIVDEAQAIKNAATKQATAIRSLPAGTGSPSPAPRWRTGSPTCGRSSNSPTGAARLGRVVQEAVRRADRETRGRRGRRPAAPVHRAVHPAPRQDRQVDHLRPAGQARDGRAVQPDRRAGRALPGRRRRHDRTHRELRRDRAARPGAGDHDQAQTGLQPPRPVPARRQRAGRAVGQAGTAGRDPRRGPGGRREGAAVHPVRRVRRDAARRT